MGTYWNHTGKYQAEYDRLVKLMPGMGSSDTVAGELIRAVSRLGYDFYNNGMGNNTSGALNFLRAQGVFDGNMALFSTIYDYTRGQLYRGRYDGDALHLAIERMTDLTIEHILARPELETQANTEDMFDYEDEEERYDYENDHDYDDYADEEAYR